MDIIWTCLSSLKSPDGCSFKLSRLCKVAFLVMTIPHSSAAEERIFNLIRVNKTDFRHCLDYEGTLSSIITVKMSNLDTCYKPPQVMLQNAKKATWTYNKKHLHIHWLAHLTLLHQISPFFNQYLTHIEISPWQPWIPLHTQTSLANLAQPSEGVFKPQSTFSSGCISLGRPKNTAS